MKKSGRTKIRFSLIAVVVITISLASSVTALAHRVRESTEYYPMWKHLNTVASKFSITDDGIAKISGSVMADPTNTDNVVLRIKLQKKTPAGSWRYVVSFQSSGQTIASIHEEYKLRSRGDYRIVITAIANGSEKHTYTRYDSY